MPSSVASIDSISSASSYDSDDEFRLAQEEWEESLQQLEQLASVVLLPFLGKWMGRKWSHWGASSAHFPFGLLTPDSLAAYARYLRLGLGKAFFFG